MPDNGICLLRNDTIFKLNLRTDGKLNFIPWFADKRMEDFTAITYNKADSFIYAFNHNNANLIRFQFSGKFENLGRPISVDEDLPNEDLISAAIGDNELFVLSASTNSIYAVNFQEKPVRFRTVIRNIPYGLPNGLSYNALTKKIFLIDQNGTALNIDPENGKLELIAKNGSFANFPRKKQLSYGKIWFTEEKRCLFLVGLEGQLYELDTENRIAYYVDNTGFVSTKAAFFYGGEPQFIEKELLSLKIQPYAHGKEILELEWFENNTDTYPVNYYTEKFSPQLSKWIEIGFIPGYTTTSQSNRYATLDRSPAVDGNCYRLKKSYFDKVKYSREVCSLDKSGVVPKIKLSGTISENGNVLIHFQNMSEKEVDLRIFDCNFIEYSNFRKTVKIKDNDECIQLSEKMKAGWNYIRIDKDGKVAFLKVFVILSF